jgi:hypothetical protein
MPEGSGAADFTAPPPRRRVRFAGQIREAAGNLALMRRAM